MARLNDVAPKNRLIAALPSRDRARLLASCEEVELAYSTVLDEPGSRIRRVYFPIASFISLVAPIDGASGLEVGLVGNEGMYGVSLALGVDVSSLHTLVQGSGPALCMRADAFKREYRRTPALQRELNRYLYVLMGQLARSAGCARFHQMPARLARWLLMTQDRAHSDRFYLTHTFIAWMLGVRRAGVSTAARVLQSRGLITYKRGEVMVLSRRGLEAAACACYQADKDGYQRVLGPRPGGVRAP
jgi:hypothetical protein